MAAPKGNTFNNKYQPEYPKQVYKLCLLGTTDQELADFFEVDRDTIKNWAKKHPEFAKARRNGKLKADAEVASKLYKRAIGCQVKKQKVLSNGDIVELMEELPPETRAIEYWLGCRNRNQWGKNQKVELSGDNKNPLAFILSEMAVEAENASPLPHR
ncbi:hypothetical protein P5E37_23850 [Vibrio parahaemolyticus]|uniref:hypothetical protein n=1 Tax=Vibrio parahaemolyticus TaxID=670 RepID=UPI00235EF733|nr:hypothetical protein [Vibrio parahaemolyticus]MDG3413908.1 hypothetical protein [Vibrio parahaemolyticus]HCE3035994.1 hypothetical protein [Vibrio parahaemolyticus]HCG7350953.1 hypothetical protein [Vibrio parahaemolyticus]